MKYKAVVSDVDGTLVHSALDALPSKRVVDVVTRLQEAGIHFCIATGRPLAYAMRIIEALNLTSPVVVQGGASVYDPVKKVTVWEQTIALPAVKKVLEVLKNEHYKYDAIIDGIPHFNIDENLQKRVTCIGVFKVPKSDHERLKKKIEGISGIHITSSSGWDGPKYISVDITAPEATKLHGILKISQILSIDTKEIVGIGDHYNDFPLLLACGFKIAMGNAVEDLKAIADYVAPPLSEDGAAEAIERFVLSGIDD